VLILAAAELLSGHGGQDRSMVELSEALVGRGHDLRVTYRFPGPFVERYEAIGARPHRIASYMIPPSKPWRGGRSFASAVRHGLSVRSDLVYVNQLSDTPWGAAVAVGGRAPLVCHLRLPPPRRYGVQWTVALRAVTRFVAVSDFTKAQHVASGISSEAIDVVRNGVDLAHYRPPTPDERRAARDALGLDDDARVALYLGRFDAGKGLETLLSAWSGVRALDERARLLLAGAAQFHEQGYAAARTYAEGLRTSTSADDSVGWLDHRVDVRPLLWGADLLVLPSEWPEPSARSLLEAMASAVPVVASDAGGMHEFLPAGQAAFRAGDSAALATRLLSDLGWRERSLGSGVAARAHVETNYTIQRAAEGMEEVFVRARRTRWRERRRHAAHLWRWGR
jgi:glycosyltransferase involved in cell wall biosynthesis